MPYALIMRLVGRSTMSHILLSVRPELWGRGFFYSGWSMNVRFLRGVVVVLGVEQSGYVGRWTMLTRLLCSLTERPLLPTRRQRALTLRLQQHPHALQITEMIVRKELCESQSGCQEGSLVSVTKISQIQLEQTVKSHLISHLESCNQNKIISLNKASSFFVNTWIGKASRWRQKRSCESLSSLLTDLPAMALLLYLTYMTFA